MGVDPGGLLGPLCGWVRSGRHGPESNLNNHGLGCSPRETHPSSSLVEVHTRSNRVVILYLSRRVVRRGTKRKSEYEDPLPNLSLI